MSNTERVYTLTGDEFAALAAEELEYEDRQTVQIMHDGYQFTAQVLGYATSKSLNGEHRGHPPVTFAPRGTACNSCRWAEVFVLRAKEVPGKGDMYAVFTMGKSIVPEEVTRPSQTWTDNATEVLRSLAVNRRSNAPDDAPRAQQAARRIPLTNAVAFREAAEVDDAIAAVLDEFDDAVPIPEDGKAWQRH